MHRSWSALTWPTAAGCSQASAVKADQTAAAVTRVEVVRPERATIRRSTEQPGQIEPYEVTAIYAKVSGYVEKWTVDIGAESDQGPGTRLAQRPRAGRRGRAEASDGRGGRRPS